MSLLLVGAASSCHDPQEPPIVIVFGFDGEEGGTMEGTAPLSVGVESKQPVEKVELYIDGSVAVTFTSEPYEYKWDTTKYTDGVHTVYAKAYTAKKEGKSEEKTAQVNNSKTAATK